MSTQLIERMAVEIDGQGDALIMLHGLGGTSNTFTPQLPVVASRFRVIRPDLPGSGRSRTVEAASIPRFAELIIRMTQTLKIERAHFAAHSLGTIVCQHIAVQQPGLVRSLLLLGPLAEPPEAARQSLQQRAQIARSDGMTAIADAVVQGTLAASTRSEQPLTVALVREMIMRQDSEGYARTCEALAAVTAAAIRTIRCPALLITGNEDPVAPASVARSMTEHIEGARLMVLDRCGHWTMFERVDEVNSHIRRFYSGRF
jgi:pimeloyl-ACP methyl ester carboxylesterase